MKKTSKVLLLILCAVLLVAASVLGTMAYLTSQDTVTNTFTYGKVNITLDEAVVNEYGIAQGSRTSVGNKYKLIPNCTYTKDPTVSVVAKSERAYIRMIVTVTGIEELKKAFPDHVADDGTFLLQNFVSGWQSDKWEIASVTGKNEDTTAYEFRYCQIVDAREATSNIVLEPLFASFTIDKSVTRDNLNELQESFDIVVAAYAIQAEGFTSADEAWAAFPNN